MSFINKRKDRVSREAKSYVSQPRILQNDIVDEKDTVNNIDTDRDELHDSRHDGLSNISMSTYLNEQHLQGMLKAGGDVDLSITRSPSNSMYVDLPDNLVVVKSKLRGRGIWTKSSVKAGSVLFSVKPHIHVLSRSQLGDFCSSCCSPRSSTGLKKCTKCRVLHYCSSACQAEDWPAHRYECEAIQRWLSSAPAEHAGNTMITTPAEAVRCLGRITFKRKKDGSSSIWWKEIDAMQSHRDTLSEPKVDSEVHLAHALVRYLGVEGPQALAKYNFRGVGELVDLISKFETNSFTLTTPSLSPIGVAVSPLAALINHSCDPNVATVFPRPPSSTLSEKSRRTKAPNSEPVLQVVAISDIPANTELFTSYIDTTLPEEHRQRDLKETYRFTCACPLCSPSPCAGVDQARDRDWRQLMWCPRECGGTCPLPTAEDSVVRCQLCGTAVTDIEQVFDAVRLGQEALDKANNVQVSNPEQALRITRNIMPMLTAAKLTPATHPLLAIHRLHQSLLISSLFTSSSAPSQRALDEVIDIAAKSVAGLSQLLRPGHPVRAVALAELGKLLAVDEPEPTVEPSGDNGQRFPPSGPARLKLAVQTLRQAMDELRIGFGRVSDGGETGIEVRETLANAEKELSVWSTRIREVLDDTAAVGKPRQIQT